jgi:multisubunit Na+/H+ antiporter MnhG subunit
VSERPNPAAGVVQVAIGRADGFRRFGGTVQSFLNSLAPLIAFPLAAAFVELMRDGWLTALSLVLLTLVAQLSPPVLSHFIAVRWQREHLWLHYATSYNWCYWALPFVAALLTLLLGIAVGAGLPSTFGAQAVLIGIAIYSLWLNWFIAKHTLQLGGWRAAAMVAAVNAGTLLLAIGPALLE